jgi:hypothetical protein
MGDGRVVDVPFVMPPGRPAPRGPEDVDGDGRYEWRVGDASWESKGFGHATYPGSTFILEWNGFAYVDASPRFPEAIVGRRGDPLVDAASIPNLSDFVSRFLDYYNAGLSADAERMLATIRDLPVDDCTDHLRDAVVVALSDDPHRSVLSVAFSPPDPNEDSHGYCPYR